MFQIIFTLCLPIMLLFSPNTALSDVQADLEEFAKSGQPYATESKRSEWVTFESSIEIPLAAEEHLLMHYISLWKANQLPQDYAALKQDFDSFAGEKIGYPLLTKDEKIIEENAKVWINHQIDFYYGLEGRELWSKSRQIEIRIDHSKSIIDTSKNSLTVFYNLVQELELKDENGSLSQLPLEFSVPQNFHELFYEVIGAGSHRSKATEQLSQNKLPSPRLRWEKILRSVKHDCLGDEAVSGIMSFRRFLQRFNLIENQCHLRRGITVAKPIKRLKPNASLNVYPEYANLFQNDELNILFAIQKCNDRAYSCSDEDLNDLWINNLQNGLKDFGYKLKDDDGTTANFSRTIDGLKVKVQFYREQRPVHYQSSFWPKWQKADIVVTNRAPVSSFHFMKIHAPQYQIALGANLDSQIWGKVLPELDFKLSNFDAVSLKLKSTPAENVMNFLESIVQTSKVYDKPLTSWSLDSSWKNLLATLETKAASARAPSAVARYVATNTYKPGQSTPHSLAKVGGIDRYIELLNSARIPGTRINKSSIYLYMTQLLGDQSSTFEALVDELKDVCKNKLSAAEVIDYYFFRGCSPRQLLTSEKTDISGNHYARGSYLDLYYGSRGVPKVAYLAAPSRIDGVLYKDYFQDNGGAVKFWRKTGFVKQGHLAEPTAIKGYPMLGGKGTSMVRFYEDGTLMTGQLQKDFSTTIGNSNVTLRGDWRGPHQISFHPDGSLSCAYLASDTTLAKIPLSGVPHLTSGERPIGSEVKKICFHANGQLKSGVLAGAFDVEGTAYPIGTRIILNNAGKVIGPIYQTTTSGEVYWGTTFPEGSLFIANGTTGNPQWIRLADDLKYKSHFLPKGAAVTFRSSTGGITRVVTPVGATARIVLRAYSITVPEDSTMLFDRSSGSPSGLIIKRPVQIGGFTFLPKSIRSYSESHITFHGTGRVESGVLGADKSIDDQHYGPIGLAANHVVEFDEDGSIVRGTLSSDTLFSYQGSVSSNPSEKIEDVTLPKGSEFTLNYDSRISRATMSEDSVLGKISLGAGSVINFRSNHQISRVSFSAAGGTINGVKILPGRVSFYSNGQPQGYTLAQSLTIGTLVIPKNAILSFYESGKVKAISETKNSRLVIELGGLKFTGSLEFYESGLVRSGYLAETMMFGTPLKVAVAGLSACRSLRYTNPSGRGESCSVSFYEDGTSILSGVSAKTFKIDERYFLAGQPLLFDETGALFFD